MDTKELTFIKYLFGLPSSRMTETLAVFVQADTPQDSAEMTFVPLGITMKLRSISADRLNTGYLFTLDNGLMNRKVSFDPYFPTK